MTDEQFALVEAFANAPVPVSPIATEHELDKLIGTMAATLKAPRTSLDQGKLKLAVYRRVLGHLPISTLQRIAEEAVRTLEWFPTPAELLKMAEGRTTPEANAHARAAWMVRDRRQRLFDETLARIERRELTPEELQSLDRFTASVAETRAHIITRVNGERVYRTRESVQADMAERAAMSGSRTREQVSDEEEIGG